MKRTIISALIYLLAGAALAEDKISCPLTLPAEAVAVRAPQGWYGSAPTFLRLSGAGVMSGHPDQKGYLKPDTIKSRNGRSRTSFTFESGEEKWLWCAYGPGSPQLARRLSDGATECSVASKRAKDTTVEEMLVTCR